MYYQPKIDLTPEEVLNYLRKSQSDDPLLTVDEVLEKHEKILDDWSEQYLGAKVPEHNKFREVVSGETMKERPGILKILRMIESPKYKAVAVVEPQRLTRGDGEEIGRLMKLFKYTDTLVITPQRIYDLRDEYDWDAFKRELERGNDYLNYTKKILNRGRLLSVAAGNYIGNVAPYGYDKAWVMDGKRKCPTLKINEETGPVVRMIFDMYGNKNMGRTRICRYLDDNHIQPPKGKYWSPLSVKEMLSNVHYIGKVRWNWRKTVTVVEDGQYVKTRPKQKIGEYFIYDGKHEAIVSEELFNRVQDRIGNNPRVKPTVKLRNPLSGLLYCHCGRAMTMRTYSRNAIPRYLCNDQVHCRTGSCYMEEVLDPVCEALAQCIADFEIRLKDNTGDSIKLHNALIKGLEKKLEALNAKELAQWDAQANPDESQRMPAHIFKQLNEALLKEKEEVNDALCKAYESMPEPVNYEESLFRFRDALEALRDPEADVEKQNALLKACIEKIVYKRKTPERKPKPDKKRKRNPEKSFPDKARGWVNYPIELDIRLKV